MVEKQVGVVVAGHGPLLLLVGGVRLKGVAVAARRVRLVLAVRHARHALKR